MEGLQEWFAPLLWILGTLTALIAFVRLCKPVWQFFQSPANFNDTVQKLDNKITSQFSEIDKRLFKIETDVLNLTLSKELASEVDVNLLRDRLSQGARYFSDKGAIDAHSYRALCDIHAVYKKCGGNSYADNIMERIHELYRKGGTPS